MEKEKFLNESKSGKYEIIYFEDENFYYDLITLYDESEMKYLTIPAPKLIEGIKFEDDENSPFGMLERREYIKELLDCEIKEKSRESYLDFKNEIEIEKTDKDFLKQLNKKERERLFNIHIEEKTKNQFDEMFTNWELYWNDGFYVYYINCWSSEWLGLGSCQCVNHDMTRTERVDIKNAINIILQKVIDYNKKHNEKIVFHYKDIIIDNPFLDETGRFEVSPIEHYGINNILTIIEKYMKAMQD